MTPNAGERAMIFMINKALINGFEEKEFIILLKDDHTIALKVKRGDSFTISVKQN